MTKKEKLFHAQYMKLSVEKGWAEGEAKSKAEAIVANKKRTMKIIREAELPEEFKSMLIAQLCL